MRVQEKGHGLDTLSSRELKIYGSTPRRATLTTAVRSGTQDTETTSAGVGLRQWGQWGATKKEPEVSGSFLSQSSYFHPFRRFISPRKRCVHHYVHHGVRSPCRTNTPRSSRLVSSDPTPRRTWNSKKFTPFSSLEPEEQV